MFSKFLKPRSASIPAVQNADLTHGGIPKVVHVVWIGSKPFPNTYRDNLRTWQEHNPDYKVRLWRDDNLPTMQNQWVLDALAQTPGMPIPVRVDIIRLELLALFGGIYTDADSWCLRPLDDMLDRPLDPFTLQPIPPLTLFGMTGNRGNVQNATLGAEPLHPAYRMLRDGIGPRYLRLQALQQNQPDGRGYEIFDLFGTRYITKILRAFPDFVQIDKGHFKGTRELICVKGQDNLDQAYIAHANDVSWKKPGTDNRLRLIPAHPTT